MKTHNYNVCDLTKIKYFIIFFVFLYIYNHIIWLEGLIWKNLVKDEIYVINFYFLVQKYYKIWNVFLEMEINILFENIFMKFLPPTLTPSGSLGRTTGDHQFGQDICPIYSDKLITSDHNISKSLDVGAL